MALTNGKFNGERLKRARILRGYTISQLADEVGVTKQSISLFENNKSLPKPDTLFKICNTLNYNRKYFFEIDKGLVKENEVFFRSLASTTKTSIYAQVSYLEMLGQISEFIGRYINFPKWNIPDIDFSEMDPKEAARILRDHWGLGRQPIPNVIKVLEINGVLVSSIKVNQFNIDAYSIPIVKINESSHPLMILCEDKCSAVRRQFDASHELGHIVLHRGVSLESLSNEEQRILEKEADSFASEFLLPEEGFLPDLVTPNDINSYKELKIKWRTSIGAMIVKARKMDVIDQTTYQLLMRKISSLGWRTREPYDDQLPLNRPVLLKKAVEMLLDHNKIPNGDFMNEMSLYGYTFNRDEVEFMLGLEPDFLKPKVSNNILISFKKRDQ